MKIQANQEVHIGRYSLAAKGPRKITNWLILNAKKKYYKGELKEKTESKKDMGDAK